MTIKQFENEVYINQTSGEVFTSVRGLARLCNVSPSTISRWEGVALADIKTATVQTGRGIQGVALIDVDKILEAVGKYRPQLLTAMAKAGAIVYLHQLGGASVISTASADLDTTLKALWNSQRDNHRLIYHRNMNANEAEKLHRLAFGESIADYKARRPVFAEALENDTSNERFSPDHSDVEEIQKLVLLRRSFVRAKQAHKANPYAVAVAALNA